MSNDPRGNTPEERAAWWKQHHEYHAELNNLKEDSARATENMNKIDIEKRKLQQQERIESDKNISRVKTEEIKRFSNWELSQLKHQQDIEKRVGEHRFLASEAAKDRRNTKSLAHLNNNHQRMMKGIENRFLASESEKNRRDTKYLAHLNNNHQRMMKGIENRFLASESAKDRDAQFRLAVHHAESEIRKIDKLHFNDVELRGIDHRNRMVEADQGHNHRLIEADQGHNHRLIESEQGHGHRIKEENNRDFNERRILYQKFVQDGLAEEQTDRLTKDMKLFDEKLEIDREERKLKIEERMSEIRVREHVMMILVDKELFGAKAPTQEEIEEYIKTGKMKWTE